MLCNTCRWYSHPDHTCRLQYLVVDANADDPDAPYEPLVAFPQVDPWEWCGEWSTATPSPARLLLDRARQAIRR